MAAPQILVGLREGICAVTLSREMGNLKNSKQSLSLLFLLFWLLCLILFYDLGWFMKKATSRPVQNLFQNWLSFQTPLHCFFSMLTWQVKLLRLFPNYREGDKHLPRRSGCCSPRSLPSFHYILLLLFFLSTCPALRAAVIPGWGSLCTWESPGNGPCGPFAGSLSLPRTLCTPCSQFWQKLWGSVQLSQAFSISAGYLGKLLSFRRSYES